MTPVDPVSRDQIAAQLKQLRLSGMLACLDARLAQADAGDLGPGGLLGALLTDEANRRDANSLARRVKQARFDQPGHTIETLDLACHPGLPAGRVRDLAGLDWLHRHRHLILAGPVGAGKTHIATALGNQAIRAGHTVRFTTCSRLFNDLAGGHADHTWEKRLAAYTRPDLLILDDFALRELTGPQADDLYETITSRQRRSIIVTTNRQPKDWYPLFPNPVVAESLFDRLVNNAIQLDVDTPSYRARQRPTPP
jgi:DNA replication protein DnaC